MPLVVRISLTYGGTCSVANTPSILHVILVMFVNGKDLMRSDGPAG